MNSVSAAAVRQFGFASLWVGLLLAAPAVAQDALPTPPADQQKKEHSIDHYVHAVPTSPEDYKTITAEGRFFWFVRSTVGLKSLTAGIVSSSYGTATDKPHEYGTHWVGFGQRYGMRLTGISTGNAIEATLGSVWGEDPRYFHTVHAPFRERVKNIADLTFRAYHPDGERHPAYARYVAVFGNNFLSNTWRVPSESDWQHALERSGEGFAGRAISNAVSEFLPQVWRKVRKQPDPYAVDANNP
jgi:hypothetical protein